VGLKNISRQDSVLQKLGVSSIAANDFRALLQYTNCISIVYILSPRCSTLQERILIIRKHCFRFTAVKNPDCSKLLVIMCCTDFEYLFMKEKIARFM